VMFDAHQAGNAAAAEDPASGDYAKNRAEYIRAGGGTPPPGATPIEPAS
jgi:hypothetical protein